MLGLTEHNSFALPYKVAIFFFTKTYENILMWPIKSFYMANNMY